MSRPPDRELVAKIRAVMKENKLSQMVVGKEAHVSQAVISQWLASKYNGDNSKVDTTMRTWLQMRIAGGPNVDAMSRGGSDGRSDSRRPAKRKRTEKSNAGSALTHAGSVGNRATTSGADSDHQSGATSSSGAGPVAANRFNEMVEKIKRYKLKHGHCRVPRMYEADRGLGRWVNNIRSGNTKTEIHGHGGANESVNAADLEAEAIGHARLNELGFCWHAKNSYKHAERSRLYDMNDTERLLHPDIVKEIAAAMGKEPTDAKVKADLEQGIKEKAGEKLICDPFTVIACLHY
jgi:hypothetical protein